MLGWVGSKLEWDLSLESYSHPLLELRFVLPESAPKGYESRIVNGDDDQDPQQRPLEAPH